MRPNVLRTVAAVVLALFWSAQLNADTLVAFYPFSGNANDVSGNALHGTVNGASLTTDRFGNANSAYFFDGTNDYIEVQDSALLNPSSITLAAFVKVASIEPDEWRGIINKAPNVTSGYVLQLGENPDNPIASPTGFDFALATGSGYVFPQHNFNPQLDTWYHLAATYDGSGVKVFIDGTIISETSYSGPIIANNEVLHIGQRLFREYWHGAIDDVRIYDYALTEMEINKLIPELTILTELLIDNPPVTREIIGDIEITAGAQVDVTPGYTQTSATLETILAVTHTGKHIGSFFANEGEHLRDGLFVDAVTYNANDITVDILQAAPGDVNGDKLVDADDIQLILAANSFGNPDGGPYTWLQGDNNGDGLVDSADIQNILATTLFGADAYAALSANVNVPEPSTLALAAVALLGLVACGRRKRSTPPPGTARSW